MRQTLRALLLIFVSVTSTTLAMGQKVAVSKTTDGNGWTLTNDGKPFYIKGAGGDGSKKLLLQCGGNSFRTWGVDGNTGKLLDEAQRLGLTVTLGIWLGHERHGFDYSDIGQVTRQMDEVRASVERYKDHPALLMWALGNEMEGDGNNAAIWTHIESLAAMVKKIDDKHPTMTVIAELGGRKVEAIHRLCPTIDVVGINSYGGVHSVPERYRKAGGTKPYVVTEYGLNGTWEWERNKFGTVDEPTSTAKSTSYRKAYESLLKDKELCLGSYAFIWGHKQEATATWFGMLLPDGKRLASVDSLAKLWSGNPLPNQCPAISNLRVKGGNIFTAGATASASFSVRDPDNDKLESRWVLTRDDQRFSTGGDAQAQEKEFADSVVASGLNTATIKMPQFGGIYRLYAYVWDDANGAAVANISLKVNGPSRPVVANKAKLPFAIAGEPNKNAPYAPSGYMGNAKAITMDENWTKNPHSGKTCIRASYTEKSGWAGVVWQNPPNDWGDKAGGFDLTGAKKLSFWVRGSSGGEKIKFGFGIIGSDKQFHDTAKIEQEILLTNEWKKQTFDVSKKDLTCVKTGFVWVVGAEGEPIEFFIDDVVFE